MMEPCRKTFQLPGCNEVKQSQAIPYEQNFHVLGFTRLQQAALWCALQCA